VAEPHPLGLAYTREFPGEVAAFLATLGDEAVTETLNDLPAEHAAALVARLPHGHAVRVLVARDDEHVAGWLNAASVDHALALLLHLDDVRRTSVLALLPDRRTRRTLRRLLNYPQTAVGALVDPTATRLNAAMAVVEAIAILRVDNPASEQSIWLVNDDGGYVGRLDLCRVLVAPSARLRLDELLIPVRPLRADITLLNARDFSEWQKYLELPVVDHLDHMLGTLSRARLLSALAAGRPARNGLIPGASELTQQYFRVLGICLGDLFGRQGRSR
jgi:Mg/Co/Ni transporter MgtE